MARILIVDSYPFVRELLSEELVCEGNMVVALGKPELIHELIGSFNPDVVVLDLFLDGKIRWSVLERIKKQNPFVPVLIFTGSLLHGDPRLSLAQGFVTKSFAFAEIKQNISAILNKVAFA
jgi:CheY-like chemotaxis protein